MEQVKQSLFRAIKKDTWHKMIIFFSVCFFTGLILGSIFPLPAHGTILGVILGFAVTILYRNASLSPDRMEKNLEKCFHDPSDRPLFQENAQNQIVHTETKHYEMTGAGLDMWVTPDWFILISTSIRLICPHCRIKKITKSAIQTSGINRTEIEFTDGKDCSSEYSQLYETLADWNYKRLL